MKLSDFDYILPPERIAQTPAEPRDSSRLLVLSRQDGQIQDKVFRDIECLLGENDVLVVNQTRVLRARLKGKLESEKECEIFLHKELWENRWDCLVYPGKKLKVGTDVKFRDEKGIVLLSAKVTEISDKGRIVTFSESGKKFYDILEQIGQVPLPPYIKGTSSEAERYQTVYNDASQMGSVAAPTAGLHFTAELLEKLKKKWVQIEYVTLHVGLWTFMNVETENIQDHHMHSETIIIDRQTTKRLNTAKQNGKRIIAVGTTSVRTLESFSRQKWVLDFGQKETQIFIYPWYSWLFVDALITNFHLPKSTLLMLVSSFAGSENIKKAYRHAIDSEYRFFSFGDAMLIVD